MADQHEQTTQRQVPPEAGGGGDARPPVAMASDDADVAVSPNKPVDRADHEHGTPAEAPPELTDAERALLADLFAIVEEHADEVATEVDRERVVRSEEHTSELQSRQYLVCR